MTLEYRLDELDQVAEKLLDRLGRAPRILCLDGELGAGKTSLVAAICRKMGVQEAVSSPTYAIVNQYADGAGRPLYHIDCYRLETLDEALDIGMEDYLDGHHWALVEWAGLIEPLLPQDVCILRLESIGQGRARRLTLSTL